VQLEEAKVGVSEQFEDGLTLAITKVAKIRLDQSEINAAYPSSSQLKQRPTFVDIKSTSAQTLLLTKDGLLFSADNVNPAAFEDHKNFRLTHMKRPTNIVKIAAGPNHFMALKKVIRPAFAEWTPMMIHDWLESTTLGFLQNIIKNSRIDGKTLINAPDSYYLDTLGIEDENKAFRLKHLIESLRDECILEISLYGWGDNKLGQLGIFDKKIIY
jgi:hypothetical protein